MMSLHEIDRSLQVIRTLEGSGTLPAQLPDQTKLDLASSGFDPESLDEFIRGLGEDLKRASHAPYRPADLIIPNRERYGSAENLGRIISSVAGQGNPLVYDSSGAVDFKRRAVDMGYLDLDPSEVSSPLWRPEYSYVAGEMFRDQLSREFQGEKPGSSSIDNIFRAMGDWLTPRGLWQAALELDLWWDFGAVEQEFNSWNDKWHAVLDEPYNPAKWIDFLTGPLDDLIWPVVNWALILSGIGNVAVAGKALYGGGKIAASAHRATGIYRLTQIGRRADVVADLQREGVIATRLMSAHSPMLVRQGERMAQWRKLSSVTLAKKANQEIMRQGLASRVQGLFDDRPGLSLASETGIDDLIGGVMSNDVADWAVDLFFTPTHILPRGAITGTFKALSESRLGRGVRGWASVTENQKLGAAFHDPIVEYLQREGAQETLDRFERLFKDKGIGTAIAETFHGGDREAAGAAMAWVVLTSAIDGQSKAIANLGREVFDLTPDMMEPFLRSRNTILAQLRHLDPFDVDTFLRDAARYEGLFEEGVEAVGRVKRGGKIAARHRTLASRFGLESAADAAKRGGATPPNHVKLYGRHTPGDPGDIVWSPTQMDGSSAVTFVSVDEYAEMMGISKIEAASRLGQETVDLPDVLGFRYKQANGRLWKPGQESRIRLFDQEKLADMRRMIGVHNSQRLELIAGILQPENVSAASIKAFLPDVLDTFGNWSDFSVASVELDDLLRTGVLHDLPLAPAINPTTGRPVSLFPKSPGSPSLPEGIQGELFRNWVEAPEKGKLIAGQARSYFNPLLRSVDPTMGRVTVARASTLTKQEMLGFVAEKRAWLNRYKEWKTLKSLWSPQGIQNVLRDADTILGEGATTANALDEALRAAVAANKVEGVGEPSLKKLRRLLELVRRDEIDLPDIDRWFERQLHDLVADPLWGRRFLTPDHVGWVDNAGRYVRPSDVAAELEAKIKYALRRSHYVASEVDVPENIARRFAGRGYKVVYGVEYGTPREMLDLMPEFGAATAREARRATLGLFFHRQEPEFLRAVKHRALQTSMYGELKQAGFNLGSLDNPGADYDRLMSDLRAILEARQGTAQALIDQSEYMRFTEKIGARWTASRTPFSLERLASEMSFDEIHHALVHGKGYTETQFQAIYRGLMKSQALGWRNQGLYSIESYLRSHNNVVDGLKLLGRHRAGDKFLTSKNIGAIASQYTGMFAGGALAGLNEARDPDSTPLSTAASAGVGMLVGRAAGTAVAKHFVPDLELVGGKMAGLAKLTGRMEQSNTWLKYGYVADYVANLRDFVRFTINPVFDASRYTESYTLAQVADLPQGVTLPPSQSPQAYRRIFARNLRRQGMGAEEAAQKARIRWDRVRDEFAATARGDFDWEIIDGVGRRFSSVGILGFTPAHQMAATFGHLTDAGVDARKAYEIVRDIHTYGITGRSPAELSTNFVFFPFSFTKKVVTHLGKWLTNDIGRAVILHDMVATYQALNEQYDLSQVWQDRLPALGRLHRLNLLAYGIGLGQFGGVNAPIIQAAQSLPVVGDALTPPVGIDEIVNLFIPQAVMIRDQQDADNVTDALRRALPVINDIDALLDGMRDQARVVFSDTHMTAEAEQQRAFDEWREFQDSLIGQLEQAGWSWDKARRDPTLSALIDSKRTEISLKYPVWKYTFGNGLQTRMALDMEMDERLTNPSEGQGDLQLAVFRQEVEYWEDRMQAVGLGTFDDPGNIPPEAYEMLRGRALELVRENPNFLRLYNRFWRRILGDITRELA